MELICGLSMKVPSALRLAHRYDLPADTIDLLEQVIRTGAGNQSTQSDLTIVISVSTTRPYKQVITR